MSMSDPARAPQLAFSLPSDGGKAVLLIHGMTGAPGEMKFLARRLHKRGFAIAAPLLAGHGRDEAHLLRTGWSDWLGSVAEAYDRLRSAHDEVYVAGICVGGALGLALAAEQPGIRGAAVYSMTYRYDGWNMKRRYSAMAPFVVPLAGLPLVRRLSFAEPYPFGLKDERLRAGMAATQSAVIPGVLDRVPLGAIAQMHRLAERIDRLGPRIRTPTLILHARDDDMSHPRNALRLRDALAGPVELRLLDDCFHMIHVDRQRDLVGDLTAEFFGAPQPPPTVRARRVAEPADA
jgi:carboxylesterase